MKQIIALSSADDTFSVGPTYRGFAVNGLGGNDIINTSYGNDTINGGAGNDSIYSPGGNDVLHGGAGNDSISFGGDGTAALFGDAGDDNLNDYGGHSVLNGGIGNDTLVSTGRDVDIGGWGADTFVFVWVGKPIEVLVKDFNPMAGDKLDLGQLGYWNQNGYHPLTADALEVQDRDLVVHSEFGDALIRGVGDQVELIGIQQAVASGVIVLDDGNYGAKG